ncbi:MAG: LPS-assembly protein LptD [Tannerella sp.]|nr:LPS-assembly protein LptD [Tannerella sp.]
MKRILLYMLLLIGAGCKVTQPPVSKAEPQPDSSPKTKSVKVSYITDSLKSTGKNAVISSTDTFAAKTDTSAAKTDTFAAETDTSAAKTDSLISVMNSLITEDHASADTGIKAAAQKDSLFRHSDMSSEERRLTGPTTDEIPPGVLQTDSLTTLLDSMTTLLDSMTPANNSELATDSLATDSVPVKKGALEATVDYEANDSIVWTAGNMAYLYGEGDVKYQDIELKAEIIQMSMDSSLLYAVHGVDSLGDEFGHPVFSEGEQNLEAKEMHYNFRTGKASARYVVTEQGEGYVTADVTKKMADDVMYMEGGKYTACEEHDHPHYYIHMTKAKVRPGKDIVTGPAYLVIEDVPLFPLVLPFAFFPFTDSYSSGILMPTYGDEMNRGFFLRDGGYYFALSDYYDLALTGEYYTKGTWGVSGKTSYRKRYKYSGSASFSYLTTITGDKGLDDYQKRKDFSIKISHSQDPKANPFRTISANVDFSSSSYDRNQQTNIANATQNNKGSSVSLSQRFPNSPFSLSAAMNINQRSQDSSISVTLPDMTLSMTRIYPLKRKNAIGKERWYEKISLSYNAQLRNSISTKEDLLLKSNIVKDWNNGMQHRSDINATYNILDHINISPNISYTERWYTHEIKQSYDPNIRRLTPTDTTYGFYRIYNYSASVSASTTLYGEFIPWKPFRRYVTKIRHRMDPSISFSAVPDFGDPKYGYYNYYTYINGLGASPDTISGYYSPFAGQLFGVPGQGKSGSISFSIDNNVEAKVRSADEPSGEKKISIIDKLAGSMTYNLVADSCNWSDLNTSMRLKITKSYTLNLNAMFDTYAYGYNEKTGQAYKINKPRWTVGKGIGRLRSTGTSFSYTFNNDTFKKLFGGGDESKKNNRSTDDDMTGEDELYDPDDPYAPEEETAAETKNDKKGSLFDKKKQNDGDYDYDGYYKVNIPWSFSFNYNLSVGYDKFNPVKMEYNYKFVHALSFNGSIQPTKNWRINFNATYDVENHKVSYATCNISRTMHCWQMSASIIPIGPYKSYSFSISANASMLKDLKYDQSSGRNSGQAWY